MNKNSLPPRCHTSILSPQFKYVPAACTNLAATFARVRAERLRAQSGADEGDDSLRRPAGTAALGVEVLEAVWLPGTSPGGAPANATQTRAGTHLTLLHGRGTGNG